MTEKKTNPIASMFDVVKRSGEKHRKEIEQWSKDNPPDREITIPSGDPANPDTVGLWNIPDGSTPGVAYAYKRKNGYSPHGLVNLPTELVEAAYRLLFEGGCEGD